MNQAIADIIKSHIEGLDFVDKIAGLTRVLTFDMKGKDNTVTQGSYPVACCVTADDCKEGAYNDLMPNSQYKTVIYFEDMGVTADRIEGRYSYFISNVRLVCWINAAKILGDTCQTGTACTLSAHLIAEIVRALPEFKQHHNPFNMVLSKVTSQEVSSPSIFSQYTYDEKHTQYLMYPYDYFALDIQTEFAICMKGTSVYDSDCGHRIDTLDAPVATAGTGMTKTSFIANWNSVTDATGYSIDVSTDSGFTDKILQDERIGNVLSISITGLDAETNYYYRIRAYNDFTESENSNIITVTTSQITFNDYFLPSKDESAEIWNEIASHGLGGFNAIGYGIYRSSSDTTDIISLQGTAWATDMLVAGVQQKLPKGNGYSARACRSFISAINYNIRDLGPAGGYIFIKTDNGNGTFTYYELAPSDVAGTPVFSNKSAPADYLGTGTAIGTGQSGTNAIINQAGHTTSAAKLCNDLVVVNP